MQDDNFLPNNFRDPYDRLEELEILVTGQGLALEQASEQLKTHADNFVQISQGLLQIVETIRVLKMQNSSLQQQSQNMHHRIRVLENKEEK